MASGRRHIVVRKSDVIVIGGFEIDGEVLRTIVNPDARTLWAFIKKDDKVQPVAYDEQRVIWLEETDLERVDAP